MLNSFRQFIQIYPGLGLLRAGQVASVSIEGQALPDVRESTEQERAALERLLKSAYDNWLAKPRRGID